MDKNNSIKIKIAQDKYLRRIDEKIDDVARGVIYAATNHPSGKWHKGSAESNLRLWGKTISEQMSSTDILTFLKRQMARHSNFWMKPSSECSAMSLAEVVVELIQKEGGDFASFLALEVGTEEEDAENLLFRTRVMAYKKIWDILTIKVFGYLIFA